MLGAGLGFVLPQLAAGRNDWGGMDLNFYWTAADTAAAFAGGAGAMLGLFIDRMVRKVFSTR